MTRLGILLSGRGSNFVAIAESIRNGHLQDVEIVVVLSNVENSQGIQVARDLGLASFFISSKGRPRVDHDTEMVARLREHRVDLVCLAGYMRLLSPVFVRAFPGAILNIHPSLLPSFPGLEAQRQALDYGITVTGCTVHFVDEQLDHGVIVLQRAVLVQEGDTVDLLSARILVQEHLAYIEAIQRFVGGRYEIRGRRYLPRVEPS